VCGWGVCVGVVGWGGLGVWGVCGGGGGGGVGGGWEWGCGWGVWVGGGVWVWGWGGGGGVGGGGCGGGGGGGFGGVVGGGRRTKLTTKEMQIKLINLRFLLVCRRVDLSEHFSIRNYVPTLNTELP